VLRSIGFTKCRIKILYFYEAFTLVFVSCFMGVMIGVAIGSAMKLQQEILLDLSLSFVFPGIPLAAIFIVSIFCAWLSTWGPSSVLLR
jgi:ABC-type antimicrobial peptide transport system permease subunit